MINTCRVEYYAYFLVYVNDILILDKSPIYEFLKQKYTVKPGSISEPKTYLGAGISKALYPDGSYAWLKSSSNHVRDVTKHQKRIDTE